MTIIYTPPRQGDRDFAGRCTVHGVKGIQVDHARQFDAHPSADLYIDAAFDGYFAHTHAPLLFHAPASVMECFSGAPLNSARFCAWPGFWERNLWEIATHNSDEFPGTGILNALGIRVKQVADIPGLIGPRILCTIINEAAYTIQDGVASAADVDTAMRLGTNYPNGPSDWAKAIGCAQITEVLKAMAVSDSRYLPHPNLCTSFI